MTAPRNPLEHRLQPEFLADPFVRKEGRRRTASEKHHAEKARIVELTFVAVCSCPTIYTTCSNHRKSPL